MPRDRRSRFSNPVVVLADGDCAARYGPWIESLLVCLVDEGMNPLLVAAADALLAGSIPSEAMVRLASPGARLDWMWRWESRALAERLAEEPVRLVLAMSGRLARRGDWLAGQLGVPLAVVVMGLDEVDRAASIARRAACLFAGSKALADELTGRLGPACSDKVHHVGLGVHLGQRVAAFSGERTRGILAAGPLEQGNNFDQLIAAFGQLSDRRYDAALFIAGTGPAEAALRGLSHARGLSQRLTFVPDLRGLERIYDGIDIFVQPYVCRRLDLRLLEAMAAGLVAIAPNGGAVDFIRDGVNGLELKHCHEAELVMLLQRLLDEPALGRGLGAGARQHVQDSALAGVTVQRLVELVRQVALAQRTIRLPPAGSAATGPE